jgi:hypothetical protein
MVGARGPKGPKGPRKGYSRTPGTQATPARRGAGFWALVVGAILLAVAVVAIVVSVVGGVPPAGTNTGVVASAAVAVVTALPGPG